MTIFREIWIAILMNIIRNFAKILSIFSEIIMSFAV